MSELKIAPSILSADFADMGNAVEKLEKWGADYVHLDVMDGVFVPNITFGMPMVKALRPHSKLPFDVHLMIIRPEKYVNEFINAGADIITFHPEASENPRATLKRIREAGVKAGIVLNPDKDLTPWLDLLPMCDILLIMSVYAGFGGQKFIVEVLNKVKEAKEYIDKNSLSIEIEIDGGVNEENAILCKNAGATVLVAGSAVFKSREPKDTIEKMKG